ncbi:hypothetical protein CDAR_189481 [Caerostris darwini]|uniref:Uncharacterized protein n=1 Tax=Caerostris darwini TaxID=1538125 RepID=A0AAV4QUJ8_9ARAC|nr:hypothetical protein CDAR_189481 [Caerostris darwini]
MAAACHTSVISRSSCDAALKRHGEIPSDDIDSDINNTDEHVSESSYKELLFTNLWTLNAFRVPSKRSLRGVIGPVLPPAPFLLKSVVTLTIWHVRWEQRKRLLCLLTSFQNGRRSSDTLLILASFVSGKKKKRNALFRIKNCKKKTVLKEYYFRMVT